MSDLSWLNPTPHAIAVYASQPLSPVATQHSLPSGRYSLTWAGLPPAGSHQLAAGALIRSPRRRGRAASASAFGPHSQAESEHSEFAGISQRTSTGQNKDREASARRKAPAAALIPPAGAVAMPHRPRSSRMGRAHTIERI